MRARYNANPRRYFDSPTHSDVTVHFNGDSIFAHKIILAQGSEYFRNAFEGAFKVRITPGRSEHEADHLGQESGTKEIHLKDDEPHAVKGLVAWLYGLHYDGTVTAQYTKANHVESDEGGTAYAKYLVHLHIAASKYMVGCLQSHIASHFPSVLTNIDKLSGYVEHADDVARHVYLEHADEATELRQHIVAHFRGHLARISKMADFRKLLLDVPELSADLVEASAPVRQATGGTMRKTLAATVRQPTAATMRQPTDGMVRQPAEAMAGFPPASSMARARPVSGLESRALISDLAAPPIRRSGESLHAASSDDDEDSSSDT